MAISYFKRMNLQLRVAISLSKKLKSHDETKMKYFLEKLEMASKDTTLAKKNEDFASAPKEK